MSLLNLKRQQFCPLFFDFHGQSLKVVDHNGQPYFTAETIGEALGYVNPREAIFKIYDRNKADFREDETVLIEMEIEVSATEQRTQNGYAVQDEMDEQRGIRRDVAMQRLYQGNASTIPSPAQI